MSEQTPHSPPETQNFKTEVLKFPVQEVLIAGDRGMCAGVRSTIEEAERLLDEGVELYATHEPIHNKITVEGFVERGLIIEPDITKIPVGKRTLLSAHGSPKSDYEIARERQLIVYDTTCPYVEGVEKRVQNATQEGTRVIYVGPEGHQETRAVMGSGDAELITRIDTLDEVNDLNFQEGEPVTVYSLTTKSAREVAHIMKAIKEKMPWATIPPKRDICYAVDNRQDAIYEMLSKINRLLIVGSRNSNNSQVMRQIGELSGIPSYSVDTPGEIEEAWFGEGATTVGISSGASVKDEILEPVVDSFRARGVTAKYLEGKEKEVIFRPRPDRIMDYRIQPLP